MKTVTTLIIASFGLLLVACGDKAPSPAQPAARDGQTLTLSIEGMT